MEEGGERLVSTRQRLLIYCFCACVLFLVSQSNGFSSIVVILMLSSRIRTSNKSHRYPSITRALLAQNSLQGNSSFSLSSRGDLGSRLFSVLETTPCGLLAAPPVPPYLHAGNQYG